MTLLRDQTGNHPYPTGVLTFNRPSRGYKASIVADRSMHELALRRECSLVVPGPGRPRLSNQEKHSRRVERLKAKLAQLGVIEKEMAQEEVEALRSQIDALIDKIDSLTSEYSRVKAQKDEELKSWFDERIKTVVNNQLLEYEAKRTETIRTLDSRTYEASQRLRTLKSEIQEQAQQRDAIIKETGDLKAMKERLGHVVYENKNLRQEIENSNQLSEVSIDDYKSKLELANRDHERLISDLKFLVPFFEYCLTELHPKLSQADARAIPSSLSYVIPYLSKLVSFLKVQGSESGKRVDPVPDNRGLAVN